MQHLGLKISKCFPGGVSKSINEQLGILIIGISQKFILQAVKENAKMISSVPNSLKKKCPRK